MDGVEKSYVFQLSGTAKTRTQAMHTTRTVPFRESSKARRGNAQRNGREEENGERRSPEEALQSTTSYKRVSDLPFYYLFIFRNFINGFKLLTMAFDHRDPIPVPEKVRMPLTEIQEFNLHVEHRAVERADFDHKVRFSVISANKRMFQ